MFEMKDIKPGSVLTLKTHMSGYYQVRVKEVSEPYRARYSQSVTITVDAWRYYRDDPWTETLHTIKVSQHDSVTIEKI